MIKGTGPKSRILKEDVVAFIKQAMEGIGSGYGGGGASAQGLAGGGSGIPPIPEVDFSKFGETERVELSRINKLSAKNLHRAWLNVPMVTHHDSADVTEMEAFRKELKASAKEGDPKVTGLAFHMKALVATLKAFPKLNSSLAADGESLFMKKYFHIGIAVDTPNGLVVPVFRDVDTKSINTLADEMSDMSARARAKKLKPDEMQGASMTISSLGGIGGTAFTPIVNPPEVAILGITRASMQPVWNGKEFVPRLMCPLDLSYDHRVVDGADAARFMAHLRPGRSGTSGGCCSDDPSPDIESDKALRRTVRRALRLQCSVSAPTYPTFISSAILPSRRSRVQREVSADSMAETSRWQSTKPTPRPYSR